MTKLIDYFEQYALTSLEKQEKLTRLAGEHMMELDLAAGIARFANNLEFPFQVLGTESENTLTWLWAWSEEQTEIPESLITSALELKQWGEKEGLEEFTIPSLDLNRADGAMLSLIASEVCRASCYYRDHYEGGALFILLSGIEIDKQYPFDRAGFIRQFKDILSRYEFNHRNAFAAYFRMKRLPLSEDKDMVSGELATGERLIAEFDGNGRLLTINGEPIS